MSCRCAPALVALRSEINEHWPDRDKRSDGCCGDAAHAARKSDHNADRSGYAHAHDFDEDIAAGTRPLWDTLLPILLADDRTKYVIYERRIMYPDGTNKAYTGANAHDHHLHLSIKSTATHDTRRWLPALHAAALTQEDDMTPAQAKMLEELHAAVFRGAPQFGVAPMTVAVNDIHYGVTGTDLPGRPSRIKQLLAKAGVKL